MSAAVDFQQVDVLFARDGGRAGARAIREALARLDAGGTRDEIAAELGVVVGVSGASLTVARGEICVLMGLSGSGKSTLLRTANGLNPVTRGHVIVDGRGGPIDVASCGAAELRKLRRERVAMVFQHFGLLPWRTVADNVALGLELRGEPPAERRRIVAEKLEVVGLSQWAERPVGELSGGMQQRVGLARALATEADVLLMDEPFSALDPLIRGKLQDELVALQQRVRRTILFVSHDLDEALRIGDRISILEGGRIVQTGTPQDIVLRPASGYVEQFVRHMNPLAVVSGDMIMRPVAQLERVDGALALAGGYRLVLDAAGAPASVRRDGAPVPLVVAPASSPLRSLLQLRQGTGHPVLLVAEGRLVGACGDAELLDALGKWS
jgi:glycine betaine/proline transport system ATP-binding protein